MLKPIQNRNRKLRPKASVIHPSVRQLVLLTSSTFQDLTHTDKA